MDSNFSVNGMGVENCLVAEREGSYFHSGWEELPPPPHHPFLNLTFCNDSLYPVTEITKAHENGETKFETSSAAWGNNVTPNLLF